MTRLRGKIESLDGRAGATNESLRGMIVDGADELARCDEHLEALAAMYEKAYQNHVNGLKAVGREAESDEALINIALNLALGLTVPYVTSSWAAVKTVKKSLEAVDSALGNVGPIVLGKGTKDAASKVGRWSKSLESVAARKGASAASGPSSASPQASAHPALHKLQLAQEISGLKSGMLDAALAVVDLKPLDNVVAALVRDIAVYTEKGSGTSVSDPADVVIGKAEKVAEHGPLVYKNCDAAVAQKWDSIKKLQSSLAAAVADASVDSMEKAIWVNWISELSMKDYELLDRLEGSDVRRSKLPQSVLNLLGVETGGWTSNMELHDMAMSAKWAQLAASQVGKRGWYTGEASHASMGTVEVGDDTFRARYWVSEGAEPYREETGLWVNVLGTFTEPGPLPEDPTPKQMKDRHGLVVRAAASGESAHEQY